MVVLENDHADTGSIVSVNYAVNIGNAYPTNIWSNGKISFTERFARNYKGIKGFIFKLLLLQNIQLLTIKAKQNMFCFNRSYLDIFSYYWLAVVSESCKIV